MSNPFRLPAATAWPCLVGLATVTLGGCVAQVRVAEPVVYRPPPPAPPRADGASAAGVSTSARPHVASSSIGRPVGFIPRRILSCRSAVLAVLAVVCTAWCGGGVTAASAFGFDEGGGPALLKICTTGDYTPLTYRDPATGVTAPRAASPQIPRSHRVPVRAGSQVL